MILYIFIFSLFLHGSRDISFDEITIIQIKFSFTLYGFFLVIFFIITSSVLNI